MTTTPIRTENLVSAARSELDVRSLERMFLFTHESALSLSSPEGVLGSIWTTAVGERASLIAPKAGSCHAITNEGGEWM